MLPTARPVGQEEAGVRDLVHQLHDRGGFERRKREQQQESR